VAAVVMRVDEIRRTHWMVAVACRPGSGRCASEDCQLSACPAAGGWTAVWGQWLSASNWTCWRSSDRYRERRYIR